MRFRITDDSYIYTDEADKKVIKVLKKFQYEEEKNGVFFGTIEINSVEDFVRLAKALNKQIGVSKYGDLYIYG